MKLSTQEKAALAPVLHIIQEHPAINNSAINIPLTYIPRATHTIQDIIDATKAYNTMANSDPRYLTDPIYLAIAKTQIFIEYKDNLDYSSNNMLAITLPPSEDYKANDLFIVMDLDVVGV